LIPNLVAAVADAHNMANNTPSAISMLPLIVVRGGKGTTCLMPEDFSLLCSSKLP
jgi:hypothetical protein